jgi:hypothetical protein
MIEHNNTIATTGVPPFDWDKFHSMDWSGLWVIGAVIAGFYLFGVIVSLVGFFGALWVFWFAALLIFEGIGSLFINPLFCIIFPLLPAAISWIILTAIWTVGAAPGALHRKLFK